MKLMDLHNHTIYSDGTHSIEEIILNAIDNNLDCVGITDHHKAFFMEKPEYKPFEEYLNHILMLKEQYKGSIDILAGLELNVNFKDTTDIKRIPFKKLNKLDYVLLERVDGIGAFEGKNNNNLKFSNIDYILDKVKCKVGLAHTDLFKLANLYMKEGGLDYIIKKLKDNNIFWEINTQKQYEYCKYILDNKDDEEVISLFGKLKEAGIEIVAGTDTHLLSLDFNSDILVRICRIINDYEISLFK